MCEQCMAKTRVITRNILGEWTLVRATKDGMHMKKGQYGLVRCNDPDFIFDGPIEFDPTYNMTDDEINNMSKADDRQWRKFNRWYDKIETCFNAPFELGYQFVIECKKKGYRSKTHGMNVLMWFLGHLRVFMKRVKK